MKFSGEFLNEKVFSNEHEEFIGQTRWSIIKLIIFKYNDKFYGFEFEEGATEYQDNEWFEVDEMYEIPEYEPIEVIKTEWRKKN